MSKLKIGVVDYGVCNINAILKMLNLLSFSSERIVEPKQLKNVDKIILPGIGAFEYGMTVLKEAGLSEEIKKSALQDKKPLLGICLGMQLLGDSSQEGNSKGLGLIEGEVRRINLAGSKNLKVPHMGWNNIILRKEVPLVKYLPSGPRFYFTHSYHFMLKSDEYLIADTNHGINLAAIVGKNNVFGAQFHPEKSHKFGLGLLKGFCLLNA